MFKIITALIFSLNLYSQDGFISGEARFLAQKDDSLSLIKEYSIFLGVKDVYTKQFEQLGLKPAVFWEKYNRKLNASFESVDEALKKSYKIGTDKAEKEKYLEKKRIKRINFEINYGRLLQVVQQCSIKRFARSSSDPNLRLIKIEAKVNKKLITEIYYKYVRGLKRANQIKMILHPTFSFKGINLLEIGIDNKRGLTDTVESYWLKWLSENKPKNVQSIEIIKDEFAPQVQPNGEQAVVLFLEVDMVKKSGSSDLGGISFIFNGGGYLYDVMSQTYVYNFKFPQTSQKFTENGSTFFRDMIANYIYRIPMNNFMQIDGNIRNLTRVNQRIVFSVTDFKNLNQLESFVKLLTSSGVKYSLSAEIESIGYRSGSVKVSMDATIEEFKVLLKDLINKNETVNFNLVESEGVFSVKFL